MSDVVLLGGQIFGAPRATAVAVTGDVISAVGTDADVRAMAGASTRVIDLAGRTLVPGINDSHMHIGGFAHHRTALDVHPEFAGSTREMAELAAAEARTKPPGTWIRGRGWHAQALSDVVDGAQPTCDELDRLVPDHPVALGDFGGHGVLANTCAMKIAGLDASSVIPAPGIAVRRGDGSLTGAFLESAQNLIWDQLPVPTDVELEASLRDAIAELHRNGITSFTDAALNPLGDDTGLGGGRRTFDILRRICGPDDVAMRVNALLAFSPVGASLLDPAIEGMAALDDGAAELKGEAGDRWFNVRGMKIFADGIPPNHTAYMWKPYPSGHCGCLTVGGDNDADRVDELRQLVRLGHDRGMQVGVHVTGDRGADEVVDALLAAIAANPRTDHRHYLIHGTLTSEDALAKAATADIGVNAQPTIKAMTGAAMVDLVGSEMTAYQWPLRSMIDSGCTLAASSDSPVAEPNWRTGIASAMLRQIATGEVSGPEQRISVDEAIAAYTAGGAWQDDADTWKGTIDVGMAADLCAVDARLLDDDPSTFSDSPVSLTMAGGAIVHDQL